MTADIYKYFRAVKAATASNPRVRMLEKSYGKSVLGQDLSFWVLSSPDNIDNLDAGRKDAAFWAGVRDGSVSEARRPRRRCARAPRSAWITSTPHGAEPAAGEAIARNLYELAARTDCWNAMRLRDMDFFLLPVRNPDGRDAIQRTSAWTFDHNRDFGTQNQIENGAFLPLFKQYPGVFFIDAHQTGNGYFFPPNEDPVHHEISDFTVDYITDMIGPALRQTFDDQSIDYFNFDTYDLFVPEYGDTVPSLLSGAAGMTFEKGTSEVYGKQVYEHYLAIDATIDVTAQNKPSILRGWVEQWAEAVRQGERCDLEPNELVSPLTEPLKQQPAYDVCGYFFRPDRHEGDTAALLRHMQAQGVHVYTLDTNVNAAACASSAPGRRATAMLPTGHAVHAAEPAAEALDPGRDGRGPVRADRVLLRRGDVVVPDAPRPRGLRLPHEPAPARHADDRDRRPGARERRQRREAGARVRDRLDAGARARLRAARQGRRRGPCA